MRQEEIQNAISVTGSLLKAGSSLIDFKEVTKDILSTVAKLVEFGEVFVKFIFAFIPGQPSQEMIMLRELERKINELAQQITRQFEELKAFVSEHHFMAEAATTVMTLTTFLQDTITNPCQRSVDEFKKICENLPPRQCAVNMLNLLKTEVTNPLKMAMKADKLQTRETFNKWKKIFNDLFAQFLYLESMASGMFSKTERDVYGPNTLAKHIAEFNVQMEGWCNEYKNNYFENVIPSLITETQDNYRHYGNKGKAELLESEMKKILTDDALYIIVYNDCSSYKHHSFISTPGQFFCSFRRGGCNMAVYRSLQMNNGRGQTREDLDRMEREVESCRHDTIPNRSDYSGYPSELMNTRISNTGFIGMIRDGNNPQVRWVNSWRHEGPGWWLRASGRRDTFWIFAGYN